MDLEIVQSYKEYMYDISQPTWNAFKAASDFIVICMTIDRYRYCTFKVLLNNNIIVKHL